MDSVEVVDKSPACPARGTCGDRTANQLTKGQLRSCNPHSYIKERGTRSVISRSQSKVWVTDEFRLQMFK